MDKEYGDFKIKFPGDMPDGGLLTMFVVYGGDLDGSETKKFACYMQATEWINGRESAKKKTARRKLALPVISDKGIAATITGIHAAHGKVLTSPDITEKYSAGMMLPAGVPWILEAQSELKMLKDRAEKIKQCLQMFAILPCDTYESYNESKHEIFVSNIEKNHAAMTAKAIERGGMNLETLDPPKKLRV